jgi:hypothetical protein
MKAQNHHSLHAFYSRAFLPSHFSFVAYDLGVCPYRISLNRSPLKCQVKKAYDLSCSGRTVALYWSRCLLVDPAMPCVFDRFEIWLRTRGAPTPPTACYKSYVFTSVIVVWIYAVWRGLTWNAAFVNSLLRKVGVGLMLGLYILWEEIMCRGSLDYVAVPGIVLAGQ